MNWKPYLGPAQLFQLWTSNLSHRKILEKHFSGILVLGVFYQHPLLQLDLFPSPGLVSPLLYTNRTWWMQNRDYRIAQHVSMCSPTSAECTNKAWVGIQAVNTATTCQLLLLQFMRFLQCFHWFYPTFWPVPECFIKVIKLLTRSRNPFLASQTRFSVVNEVSNIFFWNHDWFIS